MDGSPKRLVLKPFKGLGDVKFGMSLRRAQRLLGITESKVTNKYLKQKSLFGHNIQYDFIKGSLYMIDAQYQEGIYLGEVDIFTAKDVDALLKGHETESRKDAIHVKTLGLVLFKFRLKDRKKRYIWIYSNKKDFEDVLEIV